MRGCNSCCNYPFLCISAGNLRSIGHLTGLELGILNRGCHLLHRMSSAGRGCQLVLGTSKSESARDDVENFGGCQAPALTQALRLVSNVKTRRFLNNFMVSSESRTFTGIHNLLQNKKLISYLRQVIDFFFILCHFIIIDFCDIV